MPSTIYSAFKRIDSKLPDDLLFSSDGYVKNKIPYQDINLLILHFEDYSYHYVGDRKGKFSEEFHVGNDFVQFLKSNKVKWVEYYVQEAIDKNKGIYKLKNNDQITITSNYDSDNSNYNCYISDGNGSIKLSFKSGLTIAPELVGNKKEISFLHQGTENDSQIIKAFKGVKKSKAKDKVIVLIAIIVIALLTYISGRVNGSF